ncbi:MAG: CRISPR-associated protein Cas4 [Candidatus Altiarchaeota archaeon]
MIHVSNLSRYEFCPRTIYLKDVAGLTPAPSVEKEKGLVGHAIRKELSLRQAKVVGKISDAGELESFLLDELELILSDAPHIYREKLEVLDYDRYASELRPEIKREIKVLTKHLKAFIDEAGLKKAIKMITPVKVEYIIRSDELGLSGKIDKLMEDDGKMIPVEIKTGKVGEGVWTGDRIQVCGYVLLAEQEFGKHIPYGYVEYTRLCEKKPVLATEKLRRQVLEVRDKVADILNGAVPEICPHGSGKKCESCGLKEECYSI